LVVCRTIKLKGMRGSVKKGMKTREGRSRTIPQGAKSRGTGVVGREEEGQRRA